MSEATNQHGRGPPVELQPFLDQRTEEDNGPVVPSKTVRRLFVSHFLSTWNSRIFEFGAVLYLATIFPGTLLPMSIYAFTRGLSIICFASAVGRYIDTGSRLQVVRLSIVIQRSAVAVSCVVFYMLARGLDIKYYAKTAMMILLIIMACLEKLASMMNLIAVEKDWVLVIASDDSAALTKLNAQMRRIDLFCKLIGPLLIALLDGFSTEIAIAVNLGMNVVSVLIEYSTIASVYRDIPELHRPKTSRPLLENGRDSPQVRRNQFRDQTQALLRKFVADTKSYCKHEAFLPSVAGALLYLTVLSFSGQMVTYLVSVGYNSTQVGTARTISVSFEVLATWVSPLFVDKVGPPRAGLWFSTWQATTLVAALSSFWFFMDIPLMSAAGLVGGTILSRIGLMGFDLCTQLIVQQRVESDLRGAFSSVEAAWQNGFELISYASTMIFHRPDQFKWPATISATAVVMASMLYASFVRSERGHLIHPEKISGCLGSGPKG